ncbi:MAG TPA: MFS transporter [Candidatus Dormibacteraeota bacterium]
MSTGTEASRLGALIRARPSRPILLILIATLFNTIGYQVFIPIMPIFLTRHGASPFLVGFVSAGALLTYGLGNFPAGWLADRFDRRRVVALATLAYASWFVIYLLPLPLPVFVVCRFLHACTGAFFTPGALALLADLSPRQQVSRTFGFYQVSTMSGLLLGPLMGGVLASWSLNFVFIAAGTVCVIAAIPIWFMVPPPAEQHAEAAVTVDVQPSTVRRLLPAITVGWAPEYLQGMLTAIWSLYLLSRGAATWQIGLSFTLLAVPSVLGSISLGDLIDRHGAKLVMIISLVGLALVAPLAGLLTAVPLLIMLIVVEGLFIAGERPAIYSEVTHRFSPREQARAQGFLQTALIIGDTVGAIVGGSLYSTSAVAAFSTISVMCVVSLIGVRFLWSARRA